MIVKLSQLRFVTDFAPREWSLLKTFRFAGFLNQLANMQDLEYIQMVDLYKSVIIKEPEPTESVSVATERIS